MSDIKSSSTQLSIIGLIAALMGIGQNGLLVSLPFLVEHSAFSLPTWSILIAIGSLLFLPAAPYWGRQSDQSGPKRVVIQALFGMTISFLMLVSFTMLSHLESQWVALCLAGLVIARVIYGCTVAGMVPASQHWAILLCGEGNRVQAITSVSIGLSTGRLVGPILSIFLLKVSPFAPLMMMVILPAIALLAAFWLPSPTFEKKKPTDPHTKPSWLSMPERSLLPYLTSGLLLCTVVALLQYNFSPLIGSVTEWPTSKISDWIGVLLTVGAAFTLGTQVLVIKKKRVSLKTMYQFGAGAMVLGLTLFLSANVWVFVAAMAIAFSGAALLVPAYTAGATEQNPDAPGATSGFISMSHTLGYGLASLLAVTSTYSPNYPIFIGISLSTIVLVISLVVYRSKST
ncbi:MFS transporter [Vibrio sp. SCSIO 43135]|uniref:MFS transporter n=1 Tax=Vibrio sp. SCSIO 43135 TaxID=2819096 RepID=UPI002075F0D7|nr:MFS transporter [Vibrio sp. SCSIO 43135]USD42830.1 MFS transporter [Vibrio sp. SCSIO 43135]